MVENGGFKLFGSEIRSVAFLFLLWVAIPASGGELFVETVAPILSRRCLNCHNDQQRAGDFSLESAQSAMSGGFIDPGHGKTSHLVELISPVEGEPQMPKDADALNAEEIKAIVTWINAGAQWPAEFRLQMPRITDTDWWSYRPVIRPKVPIQSDDWIRTPIDAFVLRQLRVNGLQPSAEADRRTMIRRLSHDLLGLPPTPEQVDSFVHDSSPVAYEALVDRMLESPHYGERWARHWLDVVKYADTCGYDKDKLRPNAWPYRDYVVRSFNEDKPYARFVQEQLAGDVLFSGEPDGILGLGFIAAGPWDFIGHVEVPESKIDGKVARNLDRDDMVSNAMNAFCSLTIQCARCHHHKFDPITQEHYYGLQALFSAVDRAERPYDLDPEVEHRRRELQAKIKSAEQRLTAVEKEIFDAGGERLRRLDQRISELQSQLRLEKEPAFGYHSTIAGAAMVPELPEADVISEQSSSASPTGNTSTSLSGNRSMKWVEVDLGMPAAVTKLVLHPCHDDFGGIGAGFGFPVRFQVEVFDESGHSTLVYDQSTRDFENPKLVPLEIDIAGVHVQRIRINVSKLAVRKDDYMFALSELRALNADGANVAAGKDVSSADSIEAPVRWSRRNLTDGVWPQYTNPKVAETLESLLRDRLATMQEIETPLRIREREAAKSERKLAQAELEKLPKGKMVYAAATHFAKQGNFHPTEGKPRVVHVLHRGEVEQPGDVAKPGMLPLGDGLKWIVDANASEGERRAALARWMTDPDHPLVWRSIVNRVWQYHFGRGIVATPNDFGRMGAMPTHPELLDWLAAEFRDGGEMQRPQSFKSLHRLIVTSSVYRQSSAGNEANAAVDSSNQYLWRMTRRRLEAEEIRDAILQVSGVLNTTMGGPGFYLFKLERTQHSPHYEYHKFDPNERASHRRSIYRFIVRSQPDPWMTTLDCADSSQSTPQRNETLTSLQALSLLNSRFNLVMAERFADRIVAESSELREQVRVAVRLVTLREPEAVELDQLTGYARQHGVQNLCRFLLNLSEFVYLD